MELSIIVPAHNEEDNIAQVIRAIESTVAVSHELIIINDHSTDRTAAIVSELMSQYSNLRLIDNPLEGGFANAIRTGLTSIKTGLVVQVMADLCDDLGTINKMYKKINQGYDIVCGARYISGGSRLGGSKLKGFLSSQAGKTLNFLLGIPTHDIANAFKMYRKKVIESVEIESGGFEISMEIPLKAHYLGFKITEVPTTWRERTKGKSSFKIFKLLPAYLKLYFWAIYKRIIK
ncbi:MAG: glycosyltransferase family 2 protein [Candidatus Omnitrophica bacterium]|nr:glycosyltransferase family 2 protein [Candidatus Omnitrophota bacterium]